MQDAYGHGEALVRAADKDRYLAGLFAPAPARRHLYALYAFAAEIARVREAVREAAAGEIRLQWWRDAVGGERIEAAGNPVAAALFDTMAQCALPNEPLIRLIDAHGFDLYDDAMASLAELDAYAEATAGTLFALGGAILAGAGGPPAAAGEAASVEAAARPAGIAYGVAQRLRAFPRDAARRKIFMPNDVLARHRVTREEIEARQDSAGLRAALAELRDHARGAFAAFATAARALPDGAAPAFLVAALVPLVLAARDAGPFAAADLPQWRRQWALWRAARRWPKVEQ
jgi:15-cis-phytoene synthase